VEESHRRRRELAKQQPRSRARTPPVTRPCDLHGPPMGCWPRRVVQTRRCC
jgi:hypothetical protein